MPSTARYTSFFFFHITRTPCRDMHKYRQVNIKGELCCSSHVLRLRMKSDSALFSQKPMACQMGARETLRRPGPTKGATRADFYLRPGRSGAHFTFLLTINRSESPTKLRFCYFSVKPSRSCFAKLARQSGQVASLLIGYQVLDNRKLCTMASANTQHLQTRF